MAAVPFTVTLPLIKEPVTDDAEETAPRDIWFRSSLPFVKDQSIANIPLDKVYDDNKNGEDLPTSKISFVIGIGYEDTTTPEIALTTPEIPPMTPEIPLTAPEIPLPDNVIFPKGGIHVDEKTGKHFVWAGMGANAITGPKYSISFSEDTEIVPLISTGDYIYLRISVGFKVAPGVTDISLFSGFGRMISAAVTKVIGGSSSGSSEDPIRARLPDIAPNRNGADRAVWLGWRPTGGGIPRFFDSFGCLRRSSQHWVACIGNYYHELVVGDRQSIHYQRDVLRNRQFSWERVGYTKFNDQAIDNSGDRAIMDPPMLDQTYDVKYNNCQRFVINLFNEICNRNPPRTRLDTSYAYSR